MKVLERLGKFSKRVSKFFTVSLDAGIVGKAGSQHNVNIISI